MKSQENKQKNYLKTDETDETTSKRYREEKAQEVGASDWLTELQIKTKDFTLNKITFTDVIAPRYGLLQDHLHVPDLSSCKTSLKLLQFMPLFMKQEASST